MYLEALKKPNKPSISLNKNVSIFAFLYKLIYILIPLLLHYKNI